MLRQHVELSCPFICFRLLSKNWSILLAASVNSSFLCRNTWVRSSVREIMSLAAGHRCHQMRLLPFPWNRSRFSLRLGPDQLSLATGQQRLLVEVRQLVCANKLPLFYQNLGTISLRTHRASMCRLNQKVALHWQHQMSYLLSRVVRTLPLKMPMVKKI